MGILTKRVQVLLSGSQYSQLKRIARSRRKSMGALIRELLEKEYFHVTRGEALEAVRIMEAMRLPVSDWEEMERESAWSETE